MPIGTSCSRETLDVVNVVLPSHLHCEVGCGCSSRAGTCSWKSRWPLAVADCTRLIETAQARDRLLAVGHELRLSSLWGRVKELVDAGAIGRPLYALIELWRRPYRLGSGGWRYDIGRVGNWILEEPIHFFDLARWYFSELGEPLAVYAAANGKRADQPELHDNFSAILTFPAGGYAVISQTLTGWEHHQVAELTGSDRGAVGTLERRPRSHVRANIQPANMQVEDRVVDVPIASRAARCSSWWTEIEMMTRAVRGGAARRRVAATTAERRWRCAWRRTSRSRRAAPCPIAKE